MSSSTAVIGKAIDRVDGRLKVTGGATYAAEFQVKGVAHAVMVMSTIAKGRIVSIDTAAAEKSPGVLAVITHLNATKLHSQQQKERALVDPQTGKAFSPLQDEVILYNGQPIGVVVAETFEQATHAASLVKAKYRDDGGVTNIEDAMKHAFPPHLDESQGSGGKKIDYQRGDAKQAIASAAAVVSHDYSIPAEHHNPMELHATLAEWDGDHLTLHDKTQWVDNVSEQVALAFGLETENVRTIAPFVGGAFGSALRVWPHVLLSAMAAKITKRPVKLVCTRAQMYGIPGYRPRSLQTVTLAADKQGKLLAIDHQGTGETSVYEEYTESLLNTTRFIYACDNVATRYRLAPWNVNTPASMRAPGEASGMFAIESALDELAAKLKIDPLEIRLRNHADKDPEKDLPWSSKSLKECYQQGAERFGWSRRKPEPGSMRQGNTLIGYGMGTATWGTLRKPSKVWVQLADDGSATLRTAASDIGPGTYTAMSQIAAETLGLPVEKIRFELGDSSMPMSPVQGGSMTVASVGSGVYEACMALREKLLELIADDAQSPLHKAKSADISAIDCALALTSDPKRSDRYADILKRHGKQTIEVTNLSKPSEDVMKKYSMHAFGAHFVEVQIDADLPMVRVTRVVSAFAAGRIINPKTANSQAIGGVVNGIGMALLEETVRDTRNARVVNANMADYMVAINADVPTIDAFFVEEYDKHATPIGVKGMAELSLVGIAPAIANAVYHATGKRVRNLPITIDKLL